MKSKAIIFGLLLASGCGGFVNSVFTAPDRAGNERIIYKDAETERIVWRMTVSDMNDKHCYYSYQPWNADMTKIIWSSAIPEAKSGAICIMDASLEHFACGDAAKDGIHSATSSTAIQAHLCQ